MTQGTKPALPKRLASKIVSAQKKVIDSLEAIHYNDERIAQDTARVNEYQANQEAFAANHYGNNPPDSYPVQTNIARCIEGIEYRTERRSRYQRNLGDAVSTLQAVEREVQAEVRGMRPSSGRVPWPKDLPPMSVHIDALIELREEEDRQYQIERAADQAECDAWEASELERLDAESEREDARAAQEWRDKLASLSAADREKLERANAELLAKLKSGEITVWDII